MVGQDARHRHSALRAAVQARCCQQPIWAVLDAGQALVQSGVDAQVRVVNTKEIAEEHFMPVELLAKVLQTLARHQIIESHHNGPKGGYVLGRAPKDITIAQVLEAIEGPLGITDCYHEK